MDCRIGVAVLVLAGWGFPLQADERARRSPVVELLEDNAEALLKQLTNHRTEKAIRVLEYTDAPEARKALEKLAHGPETARPTLAARAALKRLAGRRGK